MIFIFAFKLIPLLVINYKMSSSFVVSAFKLIPLLVINLFHYLMHLSSMLKYYV